MRALVGRAALSCAAMGFAVALTTLPSLSQQPAPPPGAAPAGDPPSVVGRIADVSGSVSYKPAAASEWERAERNWPIVAGDAVYAAGDGQARLEIGGASISVRPNGVVDLASLDDRSVAFRANAGVAGIATAPGAEPFTLLTPRGTVSLGPDGLYKVTAGNETSPTEIQVCRGGAVLGDGQTRLREGEAVSLTGNAATPQSQVAAASGSCDAQPVREGRLPPKVSRRIAGIRDLGDQGRWARAPSGGDVWFPEEVGEDWAPYRRGRWTWVAPWGWTWIDEARWGFAPFHYGRWAQIEGRWGWLPGEYAEAPVYAPALVAFIDTPPDAIVGGEPAFGWVPLGPGELYRPPYTVVGYEYVRRVNIDVIQPGMGAAAVGALIAAPLAVAALRNRQAVTVVPVAVVNGGRPVAPAVLQTRPQVLASSPVRPVGQPILPRPPGGARPGGPNARPAAAPPQPIPPLALRPTTPQARPGALPGLPGGRPQPVTPPVAAPGRAPIGVPVAPRAPVAATRPGTLPGAPGAAPQIGPRPVLPTPGGPAVARPTGPSRPPQVVRPAAPRTQAAPALRQAAPRPAPAARPAPPAMRPAAPRAAPMARPAPMARQAPMARPAPPAARPAARPAPRPDKKPHR